LPPQLRPPIHSNGVRANVLPPIYHLARTLGPWLRGRGAISDLDSHICVNRMETNMWRWVPFSLVFVIVSASVCADDVSDLRAFENGDYGTAYAEWRDAASNGDVEAMYRLGGLYEEGLGTPQNYVQSHLWYNLAAARGHSTARQASNSLAQLMTPDQLARAQSLAATTRIGTGVEQQSRAVESGDTASPFDGRWEWHVDLKSQCSSMFFENLRIRDERVESQGRHAIGRFNIFGSVTKEGGISLYGNIPGHKLTASGTLQQLAGHGDISVSAGRGDCDGTWTAVRAD